MTRSKKLRCGEKYRYPTWEKALHAAVVSTTRRAIPLRVYQCPTCGDYHLTKRADWAPTPPGRFTPNDLARIVNRKAPA